MDWNTRLPAVVSVPPPLPPPPGMRQRIVCVTGSQATSAPRGPESPSGSGPIAGGEGTVAAGIGRVVPVIMPARGLYVTSAWYVQLFAVDVGMYIRPLNGLKDIGDQL